MYIYIYIYIYIYMYVYILYRGRERWRERVRDRGQMVRGEKGLNPFSPTVLHISLFWISKFLSFWMFPAFAKVSIFESFQIFEKIFHFMTFVHITSVKVFSVLIILSFYKTESVRFLDFWMSVDTWRSSTLHSPCEHCISKSFKTIYLVDSVFILIFSKFDLM